LRRANIALAELRKFDVERAALEERARVSRELHDGLAQDLWLAKLKAGRLIAIPNLGPEAVSLGNELAGAIDNGLAEARQAVMALRLTTDDQHAPLCEMLHHFVDDYADRYGVRTDFECDHSTPRLSQRAEVEMLRIAQEALTNVRHHADATRIRVRFATMGAFASLTVRDNGKGFDPANVVDGRYGLMGMRERAALIRGQLTIESRPLDGTRIEVKVPVESAVGSLRSGG
jgi:signal transduction histidine kinase